MPRRVARLRRNVRKPRRVLRKRLQRKKSNNVETYFKQIKLTSVITPTQGVTVSNYVNFYVSPNPGTPGNLTCALNKSPEFSLYCQMFDQFRVHSVTMRLKPRYNMTELTAFQASVDQLAGGLSVGKAVYYSVEDRDGIAPATITTLKKYSSVRTHAIDKTMVRKYGVKYDGSYTWFDCQAPDQLTDIQKALGIFGGITVYAESLPEVFTTLLNKPWADIEITYNVSFRGKALVNIAVGEDGSVKLSQTPNDLLEELQVFESNDTVPRIGSIDPSGNVIGS